MKQLSLLLQLIPLGFSALLPVVNPIGSAVLFLGLVPDADHATKRVMARKIVFNADDDAWLAHSSEGRLGR